MLGFALGAMGMSRKDFAHSRPSEFMAAVKAFTDIRQSEARGAWERTRSIVAAYVQAHSRKTISPKKLMPFPWDQETQEAKAPEMTKAERIQRFKQLVERDNAKQHN